MNGIFTRLILVAVGMGLVSCGGSSSGGGAPMSALTISSVTDSAGNAIASTGSTVAVSSSVKITTGAGMDVPTVSTDTVTVSCTVDGSEVSQTITVAEAADTDGIAGNEFTVDPGSNLPQVRSCTFTIAGGASGVKGAGGETLDASVQYVFTSGCASTDDFDNAATLTGCWTQSGVGTYAAIGLNTASNESVLDMAFTTIATSAVSIPSISKSVTGDFDVELHVLDSNHNVPFESVGLILAHPDGMKSGALSATVGRIDNACQSGDAWPGLAVTNITPSVNTRPLCQNSNATNFYLRIVRTGSQFDIYFSTSNTWGAPAVSVTRTDLPETLGVMIGGTTENANGTLVGRFNSIRFNAGGAAGQD